MKKIFLGIFSIISLIFSSQVVKAQEFFDTSHSDKFFTLGARIGFNTSNRTFPQDNYSNYIFTSWGLGFNAGVVANLNFREYLTIQPGFFFESRSGNLINIVDYYQGTATNPGDLHTHYSVNHLRAYYFTIPVMAMVKFNLCENVKWMVEAGPYLQISLKQTGQDGIAILYRSPLDLTYSQYTPQHNSCDVGIKMGTGIKVWDHYYVGVHYLAGILNAWKHPEGGKNKSWMFTLGYDF